MFIVVARPACCSFCVFWCEYVGKYNSIVPVRKLCVLVGDCIKGRNDISHTSFNIYNAKYTSPRFDMAVAVIMVIVAWYLSCSAVVMRG